jgi:hypothetical protein
MNPLLTITAKIDEFRDALLADPLGTFPILADALQELPTDLGEEAAHAVRYWAGVRCGLRNWNREWEDWYLRIMAKYGAMTERHLAGDRVFCEMSGRMCHLFTCAEFWDRFDRKLTHRHPIFTLTFREMSWRCMEAFNEPWPQVRELILDYRDSIDIQTIGVVHALERLEMPSLQKVMVQLPDTQHNRAVKGQAALAMMSLVTKKRIPKGTQLWWNDRPT